MFALRGAAVSLAFFVLFYCLLSSVIAGGWRALRLLKLREKVLADFLFLLRVLPLIAAIALTFVFVVPSFDILEPRSADEGMGATPLALGVCALLVIASACWRVIAAHTKTARVVARWLEGAEPMRTETNPVVLRSHREAPPLTLVGLRTPRVLVSNSAAEILSQDELRIALRHEEAHVRSRDNLKKLTFRLCPFPGMVGLESAWSQVAELAADDAAVLRLDDAVDLAAALVKLSRLVPVEAAPVCTVGFVTGSITTRVNRLLAWNAVDHPRRSRSALWYFIPSCAAFVAAILATYGPALALTHELTEWMVR